MILCLPFLMFQGRAQEAIDLYLETFPDAELLEIMHHPEGTELLKPSAEESDAADPSHSLATEAFTNPDTAALETVVDWDTTLVATAQLRIGGQLLMVQDALIQHSFDFTPSISIAVVVDTAEEFAHITTQLADGGEFLMEPGEYDFAENFAWVKDRFGVTWQINQPAANAHLTETSPPDETEHPADSQNHTEGQENQPAGDADGTSSVNP